MSLKIKIVLKVLKKFVIVVTNILVYYLIIKVNNAKLLVIL